MRTLATTSLNVSSFLAVACATAATCSMLAALPPVAPPAPARPDMQSLWEALPAGDALGVPARALAAMPLATMPAPWLIRRLADEPVAVQGAWEPPPMGNLPPPELHDQADNEPGAAGALAPVGEGWG